MEAEMKIDRNTVHRLRTDRGWSQEHLASVAGISLRTVQRVESEGSASGETKMSLAAAFGTSVADLAPSPSQTAESRPTQAHIPGQALPRRYVVAAGIALIAALVVAFRLAGPARPSPAWPFDAASAAAIAAGLYAAFGLYFHGAVQRPSPARRSAQFAFIFFSVFVSFAAFSASPYTLAVSGLQLTVVSSILYFACDWSLSKRAPKSGPPASER